MPRTSLDLRLSVDHLSILDGDGTLDTALEPDIPAGDLKRVYRTMVLGRRLDERMVRLQRQGRIGTFAPIKGQEASQIGAVATLRREDWMVPSFRETAAMLWRGWPIEQILAVYAASREAVLRAQAGEGPTLIECVTYRLGVHTTADDPTKYRSEAEVREWERKDPLTRFGAYLEKKTLLEPGLDEELDALIARAVTVFEALPPADPLTMFEHAYGELPAPLRAERREVAERLARAAPAPTAAEPLPPPPMRGQRKTSRWSN